MANDFLPSSINNKTVIILLSLFCPGGIKGGICQLITKCYFLYENAITIVYFNLHIFCGGRPSEHFYKK